jgi:hypothetical protein
MFTEILGIVVWPIVVLIAIVLIRPHLAALMAKSKVRLSMFGQSIETTLPELEQVIEEEAGGNITEAHIDYLVSLSIDGVKNYPEGMGSDKRKFLRPIRNSGMIMTIPKDAFLAQASGVKLSALGRLYVRARRKQK